MAPTLPGSSSTTDSSSSSSSSAPSSSSSDSNPGPIALSSSSSSSSDDDYMEARSSKRRRPARNQSWLFSDEVKILTALADERRQAGRLPSAADLLDALRRDLKRENPTAGDVAKKVCALKKRFKGVVDSSGPRKKVRDETLYDLSAEVWPELLPVPVIVISSSSSSSSSSSAASN